MVENRLERATLGGGCFWCLEAVFQELNGVVKVESGYAGGKAHNPTYREVCSGMTGHAEVVQVTFDPSKLSFRELLEVFFAIHDPTTLNRQGADRGTQYRSVVFYHDEEQKAVVEGMIRAIDESGAYRDPVVTEVSPYSEFFRAEDYHQNYYSDNSSQSYCQYVIFPKLNKFRKDFAGRRLQKS